MSIFERNPHTVVVTPKVAVRDSMGTTVVDGEPVTVQHVAFQPVSSDELEQIGLQVATAYRIIGRGTWPGGPHSTIEAITAPRPGTYDQQGEANHYGMSHRTAHYDVLVTARKAMVR